MLLGLQGEGVHIDTGRGHILVVLVWLHQVEVATLAKSHPVVTIQLQLSGQDGVLQAGLSGSRQTSEGGCGVTQTQFTVHDTVVEGCVDIIGEVEPLRTTDGRCHGPVSVLLGLSSPDKLLAWMIEREFSLVVVGGSRLRTSELELFNQVLMRHLSHTTTLVCIEVDVIHPQRGGHNGGNGGGSGSAAQAVPEQVSLVLELEVDADLVVLQSDQRQSQTGVAAEPELQRHEQGGLGEGICGAGGVEHVGQSGHVANHVGITSLVSSGLGQLVPDVQPLTVVLVHLLTTDLDVHVLDQLMTHPVAPTSLHARGYVSQRNSHGRQSHLQVHTVDQITVTRDGTCHLAVPVSCTVESLLNGFHGEVGVTTVHDLEVSDLWVTGQVDVLSTIRDKL